MTRQRITRALACCLILTVLLTAKVAGQDAKPQTAVTTGTQPQIDAAVAQRRLETLNRIEGIINRILRIEAGAPKTLGIAKVASALWQFDESNGRKYFELALEEVDKISSAKPSEKITYRRQIISQVAKRDPKWAKKLLDNLSARSDGSLDMNARAESDILTAKDILNDSPEAAKEFAERGLENQVPHGTIDLLLKLRDSDPKLGNELFSRAILILSRQQVPDVPSLNQVGLYLFTAPNLLPGFGFSMTRIGDVSLYNLTRERPGASRELIRIYLSVILQALRSPSANLEQAKITYALGRMMLEETQRGMPDLASQYIQALASFSRNVP